MKDRPKILWVSRHRLSARAMSGTPCFMLQALRTRYPETQLLDGLSPVFGWSGLLPPVRLLAAGAATLPGFAREWIGGHTYDWDRSLALSRYYAQQISAAIQRHQPDVVIGDKAYVEFANLRTDKPIVYLHDAMAQDLRGYDAYFARFGAYSHRQALALQAQALQKAAVCIFSSQWALQAYHRYYPVHPARALAVYCGPNFPTDLLPAACPVRSLAGPVRFLLVGRDWERKGIDTALALVAELRRASGRDIRLTLCGIDGFPAGFAQPGYVDLVPVFDKTRPDPCAALARLYTAAHFFLLPSRRECLASACIEALAFGLPCIVREAGGQREVIDEGRTGFCFRDEAELPALAGAIGALIQDPVAYERMSAEAWLLQRRAFSWENWTARLGEQLDALITT